MFNKHKLLYFNTYQQKKQDAYCCTVERCFNCLYYYGGDSDVVIMAKTMSYTVYVIIM